MRKLNMLLLLFCSFYSAFSQEKNVNTSGSKISLLSPANGTVISLKDIGKPVTLKWSVSPAQAGVRYKVLVFEMGKGMTATQAIRGSGRLVFERTVSRPGNISFKLPANAQGKKYAWTVQMIDSKGEGIGENNGMADAFVILLSQYIIQLDDISLQCTPTAGIYSFVYKLTNPNPGTAKLITFVVTSSVPAGATIATFTPPLNTNILSGAQLTLTGTINASPTLSNICIGAEIQDLANSFSRASKDTCTAVAPCKCDACDPDKANIIIPPSDDIVLNPNNTLTISQPIVIITNPLKLVKSIKAELVYFEFTPESEDCMPCNKDSKTFGNFGNGTLANTNGTGMGTHSLTWIFSPPKNFTNGEQALIDISLPPMVKCCNATIRWCIRWVVTFDDCTICNQLVCYEKIKDDCGTGIPSKNLKN